ncbi:ATPase MORC2A-like isoform X2 [Acropora muricata]|uniref:ATPase MORC2A-like isoform X2 n=1 Tax=Acropora muricata TaxID=159855 RepID=UPI0034E42B25
MSSASSYSTLRRAQLTYEYLHTNSTTHEFLFGALAELVDNARDASSQKIEIYTEPCESVRGKFLLCFRDDGDGMDPSEVANVVQFGRSVKRTVDSRMIGQYGNGLKSGTMRIGKDMILLTKKGNTMSCLFLSRTFHEREKIEEVVVPMPYWDVSSKKSMAKSKRDSDKHQVELNLILKYSPFKTESQLFEQFDKIGSKGTLVIVYNLRLMDSGEPELDVVSDPHDIKMADPYAGENVADYDMIMPERQSFRAYTAILYLDPRMKIYIQNKKVRTKRLTTCLYKPRCYNFTSKRFKTRSEKEAEKADEEAKRAEEKAKELETQAREIQAQADQTSKDGRVELRKAQTLASEARGEAGMKTKIADAKKKSLKEPKTLNFTFGFNINDRRCYGMFIYNCSRLIRMYERVGPQQDGGVKCYGVLGVVDVPYLVLEPTHNKQDFADGKEFKHLGRALGEHLEQYWKDSQIESQGVTSFWESFGYVSSKWTDGPSTEQKFVRKRAMQIDLNVQCDTCLKWRKLPFSQRNVGKQLLDEWCCAMNPNPNCNSCSRPEVKVSIPGGVLQKQIKSAEEKQKELQEEIRKKQQALDQMTQHKQTTQERSGVQPQATANKKVIGSPSVQNSPSSKSRPSERQLLAQTTTEKTRQQSQANHHKKVEKRPATKSTSSSESKNCETLKRRNTERRPETEEVQVKRKKTDVTIVRVQRVEREETVSNHKETEDKSPAATKQNEKEPLDCSSEGESVGTMLREGTQVEARVDGSQWYKGKVFAAKPKGSLCRVRVKFDLYPKDKYDKWFDHPSDVLRVLQSVESPARQSPSPQRELPTTTTFEAQNNQVQEVKQQNAEQGTVHSPVDNSVSSMSDATRVEDSPTEQQFAGMLRRCLSFFTPPHYRITKESIKEMDLNELKEFPLEEFFDNYEKDLSEVVKKLQTERDEATRRANAAEEQLKQLTDDKRKLLNLRRNASKLLRYIQEDPNDSTISAEDVSDKVDEMIGTLAQQIERRS